jgi:hypothetical protein
MVTRKQVPVFWIVWYTVFVFYFNGFVSMLSLMSSKTQVGLMYLAMVRQPCPFGILQYQKKYCKQNPFPLPVNPCMCFRRTICTAVDRAAPRFSARRQKRRWWGRTVPLFPPTVDSIFKSQANIHQCIDSVFRHISTCSWSFSFSNIGPSLSSIGCHGQKHLYVCWVTRGPKRLDLLTHQRFSSQNATLGIPRLRSLAGECVCVCAHCFWPKCLSMSIALFTEDEIPPCR